MSSSIVLSRLESIPVEIQLMIVIDLAPDLPSLHSLVTASRSFHALINTFWSEHLWIYFRREEGSWQEHSRGGSGDWAEEVDWAFCIALGEWYRDFYKSSTRARRGPSWSFIAKRICWLTGHIISAKAVKKHGELTLSQAVRRYETGRLQTGDLNRLRAIRDRDKILSDIGGSLLEGGVGLLKGEEDFGWMISETRVNLVEQAEEIVAHLGEERATLGRSAEEMYSWLWLYTDVYDHSPSKSVERFYENNMAEYQRLEKHRPT